MTNRSTHPWDPVTLLRTSIEPVDVLRRCGRTFFAASRLLPGEVRNELAVLYAFCRLVDDCGDLHDDGPAASVLLDEVEANLSGRTRTSPIIAEFRRLADRRAIPMRYATELIEGVRSDLGCVRAPDADALLRYAYRVASTVGLMMCRVLDVPRDGDPYAIDLGLAMQLTNIARDVREDALTDRVYLPATWVDSAAVLQAATSPTSPTTAAVTAAVERLLELADTYYASADRGMRYLPRAVRPAIRAAAANYRAIGAVIRRDPAYYLTFRARTGAASKAVRSVGAVGRSLLDERTRSPRHDAALHAALAAT